MRTVLDIDYRPVLWGLTKRGDGETRYVRSDTRDRASAARSCRKIDLVDRHDRGVQHRRRQHRHHGIAAPRCARVTHGRRCVVKRGAAGLRGDRRRRFPRSLDDAFNGQGVEVEVLNVLGAGDAFSAGFLSGWVRGEDYDALLPLRQRLRRAGRLAPRLRAGDAHARRARLLSRQRRAHSAARPGCDADAAASRHRAAHAARRSVRVRLRPSQPVLRARAARPAPTRRGCRS